MANNKDTKLKKRIREKGLKQSFIATSIGISETTFSKYVNQKITPSYKIAKKIAEILNCKPDDIFFEKNNLYETRDDNKHI